MKIVDIYTPFIKEFEKQGRKNIRKSLTQTLELKELGKMAKSWGGNLSNVERWMASDEYATQKELAFRFLKLAPLVVEKVESVFSQKLPGELRLGASLMRFDGFARYDAGSHVIWFGMDYPDADDDYLKVLLAHELSHVYRDHRPRVWEVFEKPLAKVTRQEYLDQVNHLEHLASEGLATLFSQMVFPEVPLHVHHYYSLQEMQWCFENRGKVEKAMVDCINSDQDVWKFYEEDLVAPGSPSRVQYFWAAEKISAWLESKNPKSMHHAVVEAHGWPSHEFTIFENES